MIDNADHIVWAAEAIAVYQRHSRTGDEHAIADLICDLGHLAENAALTLSVRSGEGLDIGMRNFMLKTATILGRMPQSRSRSTRDSNFPRSTAASYLVRHGQQCGDLRAPWRPHQRAKPPSEGQSRSKDLCAAGELWGVRRRFAKHLLQARNIR